MDFSFTPQYDHIDGIGISPDFHWDDFNSIVFEGDCQILWLLLIKLL